MSTQSKLDFSSPQQPRTAALRSLHVRSHMTSIEAIEGERSAVGQDDLVLEIVRAMGGHVTPSEVCAALSRAGRPMLLTSVRRALSNGTKRGDLAHFPAERRPGPWGARESCWGIATVERTNEGDCG